MTRLQEIIIGSKAHSKEINQLQEEGLIRKIAPRLYTSNLEEKPESIIRRNWFRVVAELYPESLLSHRSALELRPAAGEHVYLTNSYTDIIHLPGLVLHFLKGPGPLENDDNLFFGSLRVSGLARAWMENLQSGRGMNENSKTLSREALEEKIESILRIKGEAALNQVRDKAKEIAPLLGMQKEYGKLNQLITAMLGTGLSKNLVSTIARARALGDPFDADRIQLFESLYEELIARDYPDYTDKNTSLTAYHNFAFFESYFSNYIEGTEFTIDEAKQIVATSTPLPARDEDSHDVLGTYQVVSNRKEMVVQPANADAFLQLMKERHAVLLSARKTKLPGEFKNINNRAGTTEFTDWQLVPGTLKKGYEWFSLLQHPFSRAAYMMFMITEVHPFLDGNGRIARVMMNAVLSGGGLSKIIIPTVYREDYMGALKKLTKLREGDAYIRMLLKAWLFSSNIHHESLSQMEASLVDGNAFLASKDGYLKLASE